MRELYIAPEVKRLAFLPQENLATQGGNFDDLLGVENGNGGNHWNKNPDETNPSGNVLVPPSL